jgi:SNF2 family DNA or RNA helicase
MLSKNIKGGILAYDMGLGKTVTALSLIFSEPPNMKSSSSQPNSISTTLYVTISTVMSG